MSSLLDMANAVEVKKLKMENMASAGSNCAHELASHVTDVTQATLLIPHFRRSDMR